MRRNVRVSSTQITYSLVDGESPMTVVLTARFLKDAEIAKTSWDSLVFDGEFRPAGQRGGPVAEKHDAASLRERQIGRQGAIVDGKLL